LASFLSDSETHDSQFYAETVRSALQLYLSHNAASASASAQHSAESASGSEAAAAEEEGGAGVGAAAEEYGASAGGSTHISVMTRSQSVSLTHALGRVFGARVLSPRYHVLSECRALGFALLCFGLLCDVMCCVATSDTI
jgi:hypothetical protein